MAKPLTAEHILTRTKAENLEQVKNLNLWGNDIDDVSILRQMTNVEVLSLSVNKISSLRHFRYCTKLCELYLRKNLISDITEVRYLSKLRSLRVLWLWDNPCAERSDYREYIIQQLPQLEKLDNQIISPEERAGITSSQQSASPTQIQPRAPRSNSKENRARPRRAPPAGNARNENILCALLALIKELDDENLSTVRKEVVERLHYYRQNGQQNQLLVVQY